ncbi:hypothetical protein [Bacillus mycoides]|uniref:hypothetical protein n=1 Tax=Bacillus mycoides TaxID=1405 RepID=UPI00073E66A7|nr:hypothetical protein [Bacillus mycoides]KUH41415.1 hypothetical protein M2E15_1506 [Bacillus mycoides]MED1018774.1 hypothetical protein [Bacillus mycoides]
MQTLLIESLFDDIYMQIRNNIRTITCNDLYIIKERFYTKCNEYKGNTDNLTGLTELLVAMFLKAFKGELNLPYTIESDVSRTGYNNRENTIDYAFLSTDNKIHYGISVKRGNGSITLKDYERNTEVINNFKSSITVVQDLFRLNNIKRGPHGSFKSVTIIFKAVEKTNHLNTMNEIVTHYDNYEHNYIVLEGNNEILFNQLKEKLGVSY